MFFLYQKDIRTCNYALEGPFQVFLTITLISMGIMKPTMEFEGSYVSLDLGNMNMTCNKFGGNNAFDLGYRIYQAWATSGPRATYGPPSTLMWPSSYI
jgi:hypothetical protein